MTVPRLSIAFAALLLLAASSAGPGARADGDGAPSLAHSDDLGNARPDDPVPTLVQTGDIVIKTTPDRSTQNVALLGSLAGAGALVGGLGLYFHLEARSAANSATAPGDAHPPWTTALQADEDRAGRDSTRAEIAYGVGGALVIGSIVALIVTAPKEQTKIIHPHVAAAPTRGGAAIAAAWSF